MKLFVVLLGLCLILAVQANVGTEERITEQEIHDLVEAYKDFNSNDGTNAPVSPFY